MHQEINPKCWDKISKAFPEHIQDLFKNLVGISNQLENPHQEITIWWEPEDYKENHLVPSITFRVSKFEKDENVESDN